MGWLDGRTGVSQVRLIGRADACEGFGDDGVEEGRGRETGRGREAGRGRETGRVGR
jgi:hypothetical protein